MIFERVVEILRGGPGSGHFGHKGIPGQRGGSLPSVGGGSDMQPPPPGTLSGTTLWGSPENQERLDLVDKLDPNDLYKVLPQDEKDLADNTGLIAGDVRALAYIKALERDLANPSDSNDTRTSNNPNADLWEYSKAKLTDGDFDEIKTAVSAWRADPFLKYFNPFSRANKSAYDAVQALVNFRNSVKQNGASRWATQREIAMAQMPMETVADVYAVYKVATQGYVPGFATAVLPPTRANNLFLNPSDMKKINLDNAWKEANSYVDNRDLHGTYTKSLADKLPAGSSGRSFEFCRRAIMSDKYVLNHTVDFSGDRQKMLDSFNKIPGIAAPPPTKGKRAGYAVLSSANNAQTSMYHTMVSSDRDIYQHSSMSLAVRGVYFIKSNQKVIDRFESAMMKRDNGRSNLYHGTHYSAAANIVAEGFKIKPEKVGSMLGRKLYLSDKSSKSSQYLSPTGFARHGTRGVLFLASAALGTEGTDHAFRAKGNGVFNSEWGVNDPTGILPQIWIDVETR